MRAPPWPHGLLWAALAVALPVAAGAQGAEDPAAALSEPPSDPPSDPLSEPPSDPLSDPLSEPPSEPPSFEDDGPGLRLELMAGLQSFLVQDKLIAGPAFGLGVGLMQLNVAWNLGYVTSEAGQAALRGDRFFGSVIDLHLGVRILQLGPHAIDVQTGADLWWLSSLHEELLKVGMPLILTGEFLATDWLVVRLQLRGYVLRSAGLLPGRRLEGGDTVPVIVTLGAGVVW